MTNTEEIKMGQLGSMWKAGRAKTITFSVTEECNLACKYCYMTGKNSDNKMSFETAKKVVDYILSNRELFDDEAVAWEFVGGEPFIEIDLIDKISDYIKLQMYILDHPWFDNYRFNFSTNGLLYHTDKVQKYIRKNRDHISIGISVDGNKIKHDMQRVKLDGSGSYDDVLKNVPLWLEQFPNASTKATFSHDDLPYLKDSIISLWENNIKIVAANVVFEDVWQEGDDVIFEEQLRSLGDYILENELWKDYSVRFFSPSIGFPLTEDDLTRNYCGAGQMYAIDTKGRFYPCLRFLEFTLNNREGRCVGDADKGINTDKIRPFLALTLESQSKKECIECDIASGCSWCTGYNYDAAESDTIYQRTTFLCKMHKANIRANIYFWDKFTKITGMESPRDIYERQRFGMNANKAEEERYMMFITSDDITPHCSYSNHRKTANVMNKELIEKGLKFAKAHNYLPVFLGSSDTEVENSICIVDGKSEEAQGNTIIICDNDCIVPEGYNGNCILLISRENIKNICTFIKKLHQNATRVNIILENIESWNESDIACYDSVLNELTVFVVDTYINNKPLEINVLTDILDQKSMCNCDAGMNTYTLAPNGRIYVCPAFYFDDEDSHIGDLDNGIHIKNHQLLELKNAPICSECDAYQCLRCKFLNKKLTGEINTPSKIQCRISHIERNKSMDLQRALIKHNLISGENLMKEIAYTDPFEKIINKKPY